MGTELTARRKALLQYIRGYMLANAGRPPTLNEMIRDKIGRDTPGREITSKSVLRYNLIALETAGHITLIKDGTARNIAIPGAEFTLPPERTDEDAAQ